jgi:hypothetical protein
MTQVDGKEPLNCKLPYAQYLHYFVFHKKWIKNNSTNFQRVINPALSYYDANMFERMICNTHWTLISEIELLRYTVISFLGWGETESTWYVGHYLAYCTAPGGSRDSVVGIATGYELDDGGVGVWDPVLSRIFSPPRRPDRFWGPHTLLSNGYRGTFPGVKRPGREVHRSPLTSRRSRKCWTIHPLPHTPSWQCLIS